MSFETHIITCSFCSKKAVKPKKKSEIEYIEQGYNSSFWLKPNWYNSNYVIFLLYIVWSISY